MAGRSGDKGARHRKASNGGPLPTESNGTKLDHKKNMEREKEEREKLVLWRNPFLTLQYSILEIFLLIRELGVKLLHQKKGVLCVILLMTMAAAVYFMEGPHQNIIKKVEKTLLLCCYWAGLGILSSVGLGTGLHTFILYLGPFIATVTMAAYECGSTDFPEPPYPNEVLCPDKEGEMVSIWTIMSKVRLEAVMWGAGTAIGELPPYFMARAARLSGADPEDDEFEELEELIHEKQDHPEDLGVMERAKLYVHNLVQKVGFVGILACASIPNPLFDLAGITCGHFLIPFWTFFGATLIGKAIIKMHIQKLFVIFLFSVHHVEKVIQLMGAIPWFGSSIETPFRDWLAKQKKKLHHKPGSGVADDGNVLSWVFEKVVLVMVVYFVLSIINSTAQSYHKRLCRAKRTLEKAGIVNYSCIIKTNRD